MWILYALGSAFFAGITAILAKCGIRETDSSVATAIRTVVVLAFSFLMAYITGQISEIHSIDAKTWLFLILSGLSTGASWLCYFYALQNGNVNKVVPIDKTSTILTMILAMIFLKEGISTSEIISIVFIGYGTLLMIERKKEENGKKEKSSWLLFAMLSAVFASLTAILGKIGIENVSSNLGTAIRTSVVLAMAWIVVFLTGKKDMIKRTTRNELFFIIVSGFATGASWLCYYRALQEGKASVVVPIDKMSILVTIVFSRIVFGEHLTGKARIGLFLIIIGTLLMVIPFLSL